MIIVVLCLLCVSVTPATARETDSLPEAQHAYEQAGKLSDLNQYAPALLLLRHALVLREAVLGPTDPLVADCLHRMATVQLGQGAYEQAEPLLLRALKIREAALGSEHPDVAETLKSLAMVYTTQGDHIRAEQYYRRAILVAERALGPEHPRVGNMLRNLAVVYIRQGWRERALPLLERALKIEEAGRHPGEPKLADVLTTFGSLYYRQGSYNLAENNYQRALKINEAAFGPKHPSVAICQINLAEVLWAKQDYANAVALSQKALKTEEAADASNLPVIAAMLHILLRSLVAQGRIQDVLPLLQRLTESSDQRMRREGVLLPEERLSGLINLLQRNHDTLLSLLREQPQNVQFKRLALGAALLQKGRSVEQAADTSRVIYQGLSQTDRIAYDKLRTLRSQFASLTLADSGATEIRRQNLEKLEQQADTIEHDLALRSAPLRARYQLPTLTQIVSRVAGSLPTDGALVEIVAFERYSFRPPEVPANEREVYYLAFVLRSTGEIDVADLGPAKAVDAATSQLLQVLANPQSSFLSAAQKVFQLVMQPLLPLLRGQYRLFVSPDGALNLLPFAALHDGREFLLNHFQMGYLTSGRDLLPSDPSIQPARQVVVMADPTFANSRNKARPPSTGLWRDARGLRLDTLPPLPGTRQEALDIQTLLPGAQLLLGDAARKSALLGLSAPGILHVATHGVFIEAEEPAEPNSRGAVVKRAMPPANPLLRSALVLAAEPKNTLSPDASSEPYDSGVLATALELSGMNLWGTQLVVLSACDTGRGTVKRGQGVYGLRRAVLVAGAETLVTSLWKVDDAVTRSLMDSYYRNLLAGAGRVEAMTKAAQNVQSGHPHPYYWASFIVIGRDWPLRNIPAGPVNR